MATSAGPSRSTLNPYQPLPPSVVKNQRITFSSAHPFTPFYVEKHLSKSANLDPKALYETRVKGRSVLLENPVRESRAKKERDERKAHRAKEKAQKQLGVIGRKEAKLKGLWELEEEQKKYELFEPLHHLWLGYMAELLGLSAPPAPLPVNPSMPNSAGMHAKLVKADFHGSILRVKQAKNPCLVGLCGIIIHETENAFRMITQKNLLKLVPKQGTIFTFRIPLYDVRGLAVPSSTASDSTLETPKQLVGVNSLPQMEFELYGNQFRFRSAERAGRKFKAKETIEL